MKITFIYPDVIGSANYTGIFNLGIGLLSGVLKKAGFQTSLIHISQPITKIDFIRQLKRENADLYAFSTTTPMFNFVQDWAQWIKENDPSKLILVGGVHAILNPEEVFSCPAVDFVCTGEGEYPILALCNALKHKQAVQGINGLWTKEKGKIIKTPNQALIKDLDQLPFADRTIFNYKNLMEGKEQMFFVMASRGCPYNCPYCCNQSIRESIAENQSWVRFRSVDNVIQEIQQVLKLYPQTKFIGFYDDILALKKDWFAEFTEKYKKYIKLPFRCNMRANYLAKEEITRMMYEAGCRRVIIGLESGNEGLRNGILQRNMSEAVILESGRLCKKYGIEFATFNMVGLPGEGAAEILDTVKLNARLNADFTYTSIFYPFAKTALHALCEDKKLLTDRIITDYVEGSMLDFDHPTICRIIFVRNFFRPLMNLYRLIYKLPKRIKKYAEKIIDLFLGSKIIAVTLFAAVNFLFATVRDNKILAGFINWLKRIGKSRKISMFNSSLKKS
ncbi:MAG: B12-binding domain-containing radical SAM protein [Candidatus Omnitrophica bacterium]|nr:B12-binding domain-containing radical SAM protein [Candidatus Omnitrophota bacterium]